MFDGKRYDYISSQKMFTGYVYSLFFILFVNIVRDILVVNADAGKNVEHLMTIVIAVQQLCHIIVTVLWFFYIHELFYSKGYINRFSKLQLILFSIPILVAVTFVFVNLKFHTFFYYTYAEGYVRNSSFAFIITFFIPCIISAVYITLVSIKKSPDAEEKRIFRVFAVTQLFPLAGQILQICISDTPVITTCCCFSVLFANMFVQHPLNVSVSISYSNNLQVKTFGNFNILFKGEDIKFKRSQSKEIIAYLIDKKGTSATSQELVGILWGDIDSETGGSRLRNLIADIKQTFENLGIDGFFIKTYNSIRINPDLVTCDYYDYISGKTGSYEVFTGEYMNQYEWAETTAGYLLSFKQDKMSN